jgi:alkanesulfonate monooxygenase SsuD/methylene tetrahydromethanopterin reductase-like flavin-dependent oxidoreductase (luciferase family)
MEIGVGLPNAVRWATGEQIVESARRAEAAGFSSLGTIDRIVYPNHESLIVLAAAAAATERIGLLTSILISPLRPTALLAKQAASVESISGGRLTLGVAAGGRSDDYDVVDLDFHHRGRIFDEQLEELHELFRGAERGWGQPVVPQPPREGGPELLIGGTVDKAFERAARYAAGWMAGGGGPDAFGVNAAKAEEAWAKAGREGKPRKAALHYFALGDDAEEQAARSLGDYYAFAGEYAERIVQSAVKSPDEVRAVAAAFEANGCDELIFFQANPDPGQVDLLREALP